MTYIVEQNRQSGPNLDRVTINFANVDGCADLQILANSLIMTNPKKFTLTFGITNAGPDAATKPTLLLTKIEGLYSMTVSDLPNWTCNGTNSTEVTCTRDSDMAPGAFDAAVVLVVMTNGETLPVTSELEANVFSTTPDPAPGNNFLNVRYATASPRTVVNLREGQGPIIQIVPGRD